MAKTGMYVLQGVDPAEVAAAPFDVKVVDVYNNDGALFTPAQVQQMGGGAGGGLLLGYFSIGEAEVYRDYFKTIPSAALGPENPQWKGNYEVAFWTPEWKDVATTYIDKMIAAGYDGVYFDVVDEYQQSWAKNHAPGGDAEGAMVNLVKQLADHAHTLNPNFKIWANNAEELLSNPTYVKTLDGMYKENLYYTDSGQKQPASETQYSLGLLKTMLDAGKDVVSIEYVSGAAKIADVQQQAARDHISSYVAHLDLDGVDLDGVLPGQVIHDDGVVPTTPVNAPATPTSPAAPVGSPDSGTDAPPTTGAPASPSAPSSPTGGDSVVDTGGGTGASDPSTPSTGGDSSGGGHWWQDRRASQSGSFADDQDGGSSSCSGWSQQTVGHGHHAHHDWAWG
ncbi:endo alpha-1,4 polygalactosaminidase [Alsobacter sp. SYSU BS001988]